MGAGKWSTYPYIANLHLVLRWDGTGSAPVKRHDSRVPAGPPVGLSSVTRCDASSTWENSQRTAYRPGLRQARVADSASSTAFLVGEACSALVCRVAWHGMEARTPSPP